jgi:Flp pilus assembly pilin Flp
MNMRLQRLWQKVRTKSGVTVFEYALILSLVSIAAVIILHGIGGSTNNMVSSINNGFGP